MEIYQRLLVENCDTDEDIQEMAYRIAELTMCDHSHEHHYGFEVTVHSSCDLQGFKRVTTFKTDGKYNSEEIIELYKGDGIILKLKFN